MHARSLPEALKLIMEENGWTQTELARVLGKPQPWISRVISGARDTGIGTATYLLGKAGWIMILMPQREAWMLRREFNGKAVKAAGGAVAGKAAGVLFIPSGRSSPYQDPEYVLGLAKRASTMRDELGGVPIAQRVWTQAKGISEALPGTGKGLRVAASEFMRQAAWTVYDAGRVDLAKSLARKSLALARDAGDVEKQAAAHAILSDLYLVKGAPDHAAHHAEEGLALPEVPDSFRAPLKAYMGWALAQDNWAGTSKKRSQKFINEARSINGLSPLDSAWVSGVSGLVFHDVGDVSQALHSFDEAVRITESLPATQYQANDLANAAKVALATRNLDLAAQLMTALSYIVPLVTSAWIDQKVKSVLDAAAPWAQVPEIKEARARLRSVMPKQPPRT